MSIEHFKLKKEVFATEEDRTTWGSWGLSNMKVRQVEEEHCEWKLPAPSRVKLNFDGSKGTGSEEIGTGFVIRSRTGEPTVAEVVHLQTKDVNVAELRGLWEGLC